MKILDNANVHIFAACMANTSKPVPYILLSHIGHLLPFGIH